eukprot:1796995-Alexandrium_andersonii.AAC.1
MGALEHTGVHKCVRACVCGCICRTGGALDALRCPSAAPHSTASSCTRLAATSPSCSSAGTCAAAGLSPRPPW